VPWASNFGSGGVDADEEAVGGHAFEARGAEQAVFVMPGRLFMANMPRKVARARRARDLEDTGMLAGRLEKRGLPLMRKS